MTNRKHSRPKDKTTNLFKKLAILFGILAGILFLTIIVYSEFFYDPIRIMYYYQFDNGTKKWIESDMIVYHDFKNGTIFGGYVGDVIQELNLKTSIQKVIHLKDGTIDYYYKHTDFIGSDTT